jgi:hypothetical protein
MLSAVDIDVSETTPSPLGNGITIDNERIKSHLDRVVRDSVEEILNALLDAEAGWPICCAMRSAMSIAELVVIAAPAIIIAGCRPALAMCD